MRVLRGRSIGIRAAPLALLLTAGERFPAFETSDPDLQAVLVAAEFDGELLANFVSGYVW